MTCDSGLEPKLNLMWARVRGGVKSSAALGQFDVTTTSHAEIYPLAVNTLKNQGLSFRADIKKHKYFSS